MRHYREMQLPEPPRIWQEKDVTTSSSLKVTDSTSAQQLLPLLFPTFTTKSSTLNWTSTLIQEQRMHYTEATPLPITSHDIVTSGAINHDRLDESANEHVDEAANRQIKSEIPLRKRSMQSYLIYCQKTQYVVANKHRKCVSV
jgi:hypothetical protein